MERELDGEKGLGFQSQVCYIPVGKVNSEFQVYSVKGRGELIDLYISSNIKILEMILWSLNGILYVFRDGKDGGGGRQERLIEILFKTHRIYRNDFFSGIHTPKITLNMKNSNIVNYS